MAVTALCPGPTCTGFVGALGAEVGHTAIYRRLGDPEPVIKAGLARAVTPDPDAEKREAASHADAVEQLPR